jgi:hypothetical protein
MPLPSPGTSELDTRLAEIGRRLEEIQAGLAPDVEFIAATEPPPPPVPEPPDPPATPDPPEGTDPAATPAVDLAPPAAPPVEPTPVDPTPAEPAAEDSPTIEQLTPWPEEPPSSPRSGPLAALLARSRRRRAEGPAEELAALVRMHNGLITALGELVRLLGDRAEAAAPESGATVSAGPFRTPEEVEAFAARLSELAPVRAATIIGYEGADRALIEVQLEDRPG